MRNGSGRTAGASGGLALGENSVPRLVRLSVTGRARAPGSVASHGSSVTLVRYGRGAGSLTGWSGHDVSTVGVARGVSPTVRAGSRTTSRAPVARTIFGSTTRSDGPPI